MGSEVLIIERSLTLTLPGRADRRHHRPLSILVGLPLASWRGEGGRTRRKPILYRLGWAWVLSNRWPFATVQATTDKTDKAHGH